MKSRSFNLFVILALFLSLLGSAVTVTPAYAASIVVNSNADNTLVNLNGNGTCDLREAITNANGDNQSGSTECPAGSGTDTITFSADYTITLNNIAGQLPAITSTVTITGNGAAQTIIQASSCNPVTLPGGCTPATYRVLEVKNSGNLTLNNLTVQHGRCRGDGVGTSCPTVAIFGGGIYSTGSLTLTNSTIANNSAGFGGGIMNDNGSLDLMNSIVASNSSTQGGGGISNSGTFTVTNSTFSKNAATTSGGGIYSTTANSFTLTNSTFSGNIAGSGAGMYNAGPTTVTNSTFSGNNASNKGGGIYNTGGTLTVRNSTLSGNSASSGNGGGINFETGLFNYSNTIIANHTSGDCVNTGTMGTNTNNLVEDGTCSASLNGDPNLGSLTDNGGPTQTIALQSPSTAIDAGDTATCTAAPVSNKDQRGVTRPIDGDVTPGAVCDIGAFEYGAIIPVVTASNPSASAVLTSLSSITVVFNQDMLNDGSAKAANNTVNYILVERGTNTAFDTTSCAGGVVSDDAPQTISTASYNSAGFITTLTLASPLAAGTYRLFVCGTTSVWSAAGLELNNGASDYTVDFTIGTTTGGTTTGSTRVVSTSASTLPKTGFAPSKVTSLPAQPATLEYAKLGDLVLEIPSLNVKSTIVGVPQNADKTWDVTWLGNDTGWLNGTAFPTWNGNSVLTAHVTNASGLEGPFAALKSLKYGDQIIVHMGGVRYVYEVRETKLSRPYSTSYTFESKSDASYITLVTCSGYNPLNESYFFRRIVRAVLVSTVSE